MQIDALRRWFFANRRELPWRDNPTPYQVWISEVMLQQTQAARVVAYYHKWMERFPSVEALASVPLADVIKTWEGLGYYSRARNLHAAAKQMQKSVPSSSEELSKIKGLGPYTIGAIRSFAFKKRALAIDANVLRVIARYYSITDEIESTSAKKQVDSYVEQLLPEEESWIISEALIELGALVCTRKPECTRCPLAQTCLGRGKDLPKRREKKKTTRLHRVVGVIISPDGVIVQKREEGKVMGGLFEFPFIECASSEWDQKSITSQFEKELGLSLIYQVQLTPVTHTFTRYRANLYPHVWKTASGGVSFSKMSSLPFSSGHRRVALEVKLLYT